MRGASLIIVRLVLLVAVLLLWEALPRLGLVNAMLLPPLSDVLAALGHILGRADVHTALGVTAAEVKAWALQAGLVDRVTRGLPYASVLEAYAAAR